VSSVTERGGQMALRLYRGGVCGIAGRFSTVMRVSIDLTTFLRRWTTTLSDTLESVTEAGWPAALPATRASPGVPGGARDTGRTTPPVPPRNRG